MSDKPSSPTVRERIAIRLLLLAVRILAPYEWFNKDEAKRLLADIEKELLV